MQLEQVVVMQGDNLGGYDMGYGMRETDIQIP